LILLYVSYIILSGDKIHILFTKGGKNMATIKVRLKDASGNILHPETEWSVVKNTPKIYDKAYALKRPAYIPDSFILTGMPTSVSFGLIQINESNDDKQFQSFYIVVAERTVTQKDGAPYYDDKQVLYYLNSKNTSPYFEWTKMAGIEYSDAITTYSYGYGDTMCTIYLTHLLKD
jgi:hypothetical protein